MREFNKFIGLDVHKSTIAISIAPEDGGEVRYFGEIKNTKEALTNFANKISQGSLKLSFCYEAGGCGYEVYRHLRNIGHNGYGSILDSQKRLVSASKLTGEIA